MLFDGEESPDDNADFYTTGLRGSRPYARRHAKQTRAMILLDFIAEKGAMRIPRESSSNLELWSRLRAAARKVGAQTTFPDEVSGGVIDDHTPFLKRGVPAIDLIDFTFKCWHKNCDDMSAVSARSLDLAGETVTQMLLDFRAVTPEKLLLAAPRGYCAGVDRAVQTVERALELHGPPVYVRKEIVHNKHVVGFAARARRDLRRRARRLDPRGRDHGLLGPWRLAGGARRRRAARPADDRRDVPAGHQGPSRGASSSPARATRSC